MAKDMGVYIVLIQLFQLAEVQSISNPRCLAKSINGGLHFTRPGQAWPCFRPDKALGNLY